MYDPADYDARILSVSNMISERWAYGSLCDYSVWARGGTPEEFRAELDDALRHDKITPVCHTRLGGMKARWHSTYIDFLDESGIDFVGLEDLMSAPDITLPAARLPLNTHVPYGAEPEPLVPFDDEPDVDNPCAVDDFPPLPGDGDVGERIVFFHNGVGPMCLDFLAFLTTVDYPTEEHLTGEPDFWPALNELKAEFGTSEGVSETFGFFPIIFIQNRAFSGFNESIRQAIRALVDGTG